MSDAVEALAARWAALAAAPRDEGFAAKARSLAAEVVAARAALWADSAAAQADSARDDDPAMVARVDANQARIKVCTIVLGEMSAALGMTSLPA